MLSRRLLRAILYCFKSLPKENVLEWIRPTILLHRSRHSPQFGLIRMILRSFLSPFVDIFKLYLTPFRRSLAVGIDTHKIIQIKFINVTRRICGGGLAFRSGFLIPMSFSSDSDLAFVPSVDFD